MKILKFLDMAKLLVLFNVILCLNGRVYVPNAQPKQYETDFMNRFSDNLNNDLLSNTLSNGINDSNKAYRQAGLTLQNRIINRDEIDKEGRKLVEEYDDALKKTQEIEKAAEQQGKKEEANWGEPQERRLTQVTTPVVAQPIQPVMMAQPQPQYYYNPVTPAPAMYRMPVTPVIQQAISSPTVQPVAPVKQNIENQKTEKTEKKELKKSVKLRKRNQQPQRKIRL